MERLIKTYIFEKGCDEDKIELATILWQLFYYSMGVKHKTNRELENKYPVTSGAGLQGPAKHSTSHGPNGEEQYKRGEKLSTLFLITDFSQ